MNFSDKLRTAQRRADSWLCIGLDTDPDKMPPGLRGQETAVLKFNRSIIEATNDLVCGYKPNLAFYLSRGPAGLIALADTVAAIPEEIPIILDAKFGDIDSSARGYTQFAFEVLGVDAVTVNPYLGGDALAPFLEHSDRAVFLLTHTSNPGSGDLQDALVVSSLADAPTQPLFLHVARFAARLECAAEVGLVVGATFPQQLWDVRAANPSAIFLIPGIGAQGGSLREAVEYGQTEAGIGPVINASRSILYASKGADFADAARAAAEKMKNEINGLRDHRL